MVYVSQQSALRITTRLCLLLLLAFVRLVLIAVEQPLSTLMQEFPYFKWLAGIVKHFIPWLSTSLLFPQCFCKCSTCYHVWSCHKHHGYPPLPPPDCVCGLWVVWRSLAMQTWSQRWYLEIGLALNCPHSRLHWWLYVNFNSNNVCWVLGPTACTRRSHQLSENGWRSPRRLFANIPKMAEPECGKLSHKIAQDWIVEFQLFWSIPS